MTLFVKGIGHLEVKIVLTLRLLKRDYFVCSEEHILINFALYHLLTNGSSSVNGCRQNESTKS